jgi:hypothetical protein
MTLSKRERSENCLSAVALMLQQLGDNAIDECLFDPSAPIFQYIVPTTWSELRTDGLIEILTETQQYRFTGLGWLHALEWAGQLDDKSLEVRAGRLFAAMKEYVKGRQKPVVVKLVELSQKAGIPEGIAFNIIESNILESRYGRRGARWQDRGRLIAIPIDFSVEPADVGTLFKDEMCNRIEQLEGDLAATKEELQVYKCPYCGAPLAQTGPVELDEHTWDTVEVFECGYSTGGWNETPCPSDPKFPKVSIPRQSRGL